MGMVWFANWTGTRRFPSQIASEQQLSLNQMVLGQMHNKMAQGTPDLHMVASESFAEIVNSRNVLSIKEHRKVIYVCFFVGFWVCGVFCFLISFLGSFGLTGSFLHPLQSKKVLAFQFFPARIPITSFRTSHLTFPSYLVSLPSFGDCFCRSTSCGPLLTGACLPMPPYVRTCAPPPCHLVHE